MNSIDRVKAALHFSGPDRIPTMNTMSIYNILFKSDVHPLVVLPSKTWQPGWIDDEVGLFPRPSIPLYKWKKPDWAKDPKYKNWKNQSHEEIDEWGCIWNLTGDQSTMGHPSRASLPDWSKLDYYIDRYFQTPEDKKRYNFTIFISKIFGRKRYRVISLGSGPFTIASRMRRFSTFLMDHRRHSDKVKYLLEQITQILVKYIKNYVKFGAKPHGVFMTEDLGTQDSPFMNPKMFQEFYEPNYRALIDATHDFGGEFHQHCCGKIDKLIPLLIDWGLDALEFDSPRMTGYLDLKPFRGKIMFWGCVNIQSIYVNGTPEEVKREVWHMVRNLGIPNGGFGAYYYPQPHDIKVSKENIKAFNKGIKIYGNYSKIPPHWWDHPVVEQWKDNVVPPLPPLEI